MRKLLILTVALCSAAGIGCSSNPCGDSWRPHLFGHRDHANYGACCESGPTMGVPVMQQAPCCGN